MSLNNKSIIIKDWNVISKIGIGKEEFRANLFTRSKDALQDFNVTEFLGKKGTRLYDLPTSLVTVASKFILDSNNIDCNETGFVLGTSYGSLESILEFIKDIYTSEKPYFVDPSRFPNTVMNSQASQTAIRYGFKGLNSTISGGVLCGVKAVNYAKNMMQNEYVKSIIVGSVEENSKNIYKYLQNINSTNELDDYLEKEEGCALFLLDRYNELDFESNGPVIELVSSEFIFSGGTTAVDYKKGLSICLEKVQRELGICLKEINLTVISNQPDDSKITEIEQEVYNEHLDNYTYFNANRIIGNSISASGSLQLAIFLTGIEGFSEYGLITSFDKSGLVGCLLVRRWSK